MEAAEQIIGMKFPVLQHGFVTLVDYMGDDNAIVQAARVSYGMGTKSVRDDAGLIRYLMRHRHTTPFEMVEAKLLVKLPIYVARQWIRHRTASVNEYSARYSVVPDLFEIPREEHIMGQSRTNRQGSEGELPGETRKWFQEEASRIARDSYRVYSEALGKGISRETARTVLPVSTYTEWYWKINLHNMFHFLSLRMDPHAQIEIREYANIIGDEIVGRIAPVAYSAFKDFTLNSVSLSSKEKTAVSLLLREEPDVERACQLAGLRLRKEDGTPMKTGEGVEFVQKLKGISERSSGIFA